MSSGGRRGVDISGNVSMRVQNASDVTSKTKVQLVYTANNAISNASVPAWGGRNAYQNHTPNGNVFVNQFLSGQRECVCPSGNPQFTPGNITRFV